MFFLSRSNLEQISVKFHVSDEFYGQKCYEGQLIMLTTVIGCLCVSLNSSCGKVMFPIVPFCTILHFNQ